MVECISILNFVPFGLDITELYVHKNHSFVYPVNTNDMLLVVFLNYIVHTIAALFSYALCSIRIYNSKGHIKVVKSLEIV